MAARPNLPLWVVVRRRNVRNSLFRGACLIVRYHDLVRTVHGIHLLQLPKQNWVMVGSQARVLLRPNPVSAHFYSRIPRTMMEPRQPGGHSIEWTSHPIDPIDPIDPNDSRIAVPKRAVVVLVRSVRP